LIRHSPVTPDEEVAVARGAHTGMTITVVIMAAIFE
jgi:hypothetical protein|tara:strand:+ start:916 stop:1023 length:108 start_codon:yes stop_codon:yes gene_type:complete